jgi:O-antigen ligase
VFGVLWAWSIGGATLLLTFSRSAWLGAAIGLGLLIFLLRRHRSRRVLAISVSSLILIILLAITFGPLVLDRLTAARSALETSSVFERLDLAQAAVKLIAARPLTGVGIGNFEIESRVWLAASTPSGRVHNVPLLIASELGLPGLGIWLIGVGWLLSSSFRTYRRSGSAVWPAVAVSSIVAMLVMLLLDYYWWTSSQGVYVWAAGAGWVASQAKSQ